ncbi:hypothetical protein NQ317_007689 [Molorchus minor]|uniref:Peptidase aspartic putative domain-containing protein n=1 Tax=Molorchus minor TaxID=1323400 RepID=A0ABQ9JPG8_9CUCU|nr:hypothetical protein NQ317_007689 [Molorchus minor]
MARALLDVGSQSSFITAEFCDVLQLNRVKVDITVGGLNQAQSDINCKVLALIQSQTNNFSMHVSFLVVPQITGSLPNFKVDLQSLRIPSHIKLADPNFHIPDKVDLLIGAECFWETMCVGQIKLARHGPILQKSKFGWIVSGPLSFDNSRTVSCNLLTLPEIDKQFTRFWEIEEIPDTKPLSNEESACEAHFLETYKRNADGRFIVTIPMKASPEKLGDSPDDEIGTYELQTVTYGTSAASYLAIRCLYQLGVECDLPDVSNIIKNHFYVDDMLTGGSTVQEVVYITNEVTRTLARGGFKLRKFVSNDPRILQGIESQVGQTNAVDFGINENTKTLGMIWNGHSDSFLYKISDSGLGKRVTKRGILSEVSQIFDPLGFLSPCIILAKIILQNLWCERVSWDETISSALHTRWLQFRNELVALNNLQISRQITCKDAISMEIHGFSDASTHAYGACIYAKSQNQAGDTFVKLICAKSKVAPLKTQTVPRLELTAALLLARLMSLQMQTERVVYWCDSTVVLGWLRTAPNLLQTFVANRVVAIQELSYVHYWRHVPTTDNPADHVSRGVNPNSLQSLDIYWSGPAWLRENESHWPVLPVSQYELPELRKAVFSHGTTIESTPFSFKNYSNLTKLERIIAYCMRFKVNCLIKDKGRRKSGPLTSREIDEASFKLAEISQRESFGSEIVSLGKDKTVGSKSKLIRLNPFLDKNNMLRVGGRLSNSNFDFNKKTPDSHFIQTSFYRIIV